MSWLIVLAAFGGMYRKFKKTKIFLGISIIFIVILYLLQIDNTSVSYRKVAHMKLTFEHESKPIYERESKYLINTTGCQIPNINPFSKKIMRFVHKEEYTNCSNLDLLTYVDKSSGAVTLYINTSVIPQYSFFGVTCCYSEIHRVEDDDGSIWITPCKPFRKRIALHHSFIKVVCWNIFFQTVYENVHAATLISDMQNIKYLRNDSFFSVLLVGIDSMSKQNLVRTMPKTYNYLKKHFVSLRGYNKIEDNTYPNLMAILTGQNMSQLKESCPFFINSKVINNNRNYLSTCNIIWKQFSNHGYMTGYGEDSHRFGGTFNYIKKGFRTSPTDYYYRPYFLAAEQILSPKSKCHRYFCSGPENSGERILNIVKDFSVAFKNQLSFGFFWMDNFSHDNINCPSAMDDKVLEFLSDPSFMESLKDTIFIFYSDHGFRYGDIRQTSLGWFEERLPFIYFLIPDGFQKQYPREYRNFLVNSQRLTTPYDLHNTLQHLLKLYNTRYCFENSPGCPNCHSLFEEISEKRTCEDACIAHHWCTCISYHNIPLTHPWVERVAPFVVGQVNKIVASFPEGGECAEYSFDGVHSADISEVRLSENNEEVQNLLLIINTKPDAVFEATLEVPVKFPHNFKRVGGISRVDWYADRIYCVNDSQLEKYCYCDANLKKNSYKP